MKSKVDETEKVLEEVLIAIKRLSKNKQGAIIVIEKKIRLDNYSELGVKSMLKFMQILLEVYFQKFTFCMTVQLSFLVIK